MGELSQIYLKFTDIAYAKANTLSPESTNKKMTKKLI
jgi:hypothetical protein